jgi:hypothetical protein
MATYAELTDDQKSYLDKSLPHVRRKIATICRELTELEFMRKGIATAAIDSIVTGLDDVEMIPMADTGNEFPGSASVILAAQWKAVLTLSDALVALNTNEFKSLAVSVCGPFRALKN